MKKKTATIVRLDDRLVYHGSYNLSARAIKIIYYVIAKYVDPQDDNSSLPILDIPLKEIAVAITETDTDKKNNWSGSLYKSIGEVCDEMSNTRIKFNSDVEVEGTQLKGYINLCSVVPRMIDGEKHISFGFDPFMAQFLFGLTKYVLTYRPEVNRLRSGYAIRLFQMLKGYARKKSKFGATLFKETYAVANLRFLFNVGDAYPEFKHFNNLVIKKCISEINTNTTIRIEAVNKLKKGGSRYTTHLEFVFTEQDPKEKLSIGSTTTSSNFIPDIDDIDKLSKAELQAYEMLVKFGVIKGIAYRKILPEIKGSESEGFEDYFIGYCLKHFREWSTNQGDARKAAATFVTWWSKNKIFDITSDVWTKINEQVVDVKKALYNKDPDAYQNRIMAKDMTHAEFKDWWIKKNEQEKPVKASRKKAKVTTNKFQGVADILKNIEL